MAEWTGSWRIYLNIADIFVAWETYRGNLLSSYAGESPADWRPISLVLASAIGRGDSIRLQHELAMESIRAGEFQDAVSRLRGMYYFEDEASAMRAPSEWSTAPNYFSLETLAEVGYAEVPRHSRHDSMWIDRYMWTDAPFTEADTSWIRQYWAGEPVSDRPPLWEVVAEGSTWIFGTDLRTRAHDAIKDTQSGSLSVLELARVAAEVGSTLGHCSPLVSPPNEVGGRRRSLEYL